MITFHLPPEELKQAAEKAHDYQSIGYEEDPIIVDRNREAFIEGSTHTTQTISPTLDKALEALESAKNMMRYLQDEYDYLSDTFIAIDADTAKITEAVNEIKKLRNV